MKVFQLLVSTDGVTWTAVSAGALEDLKEVGCQDQADQTFIFAPVLTRYVKLQVRKVGGEGNYPNPICVISILSSSSRSSPCMTTPFAHVSSTLMSTEPFWTYQILL